MRALTRHREAAGTGFWLFAGAPGMTKGPAGTDSAAVIDVFGNVRDFSPSQLDCATADAAKAQRRMESAKFVVTRLIICVPDYLFLSNCCQLIVTSTGASVAS